MGLNNMLTFTFQLLPSNVSLSPFYLLPSTFDERNI